MTEFIFPVLLKLFLSTPSARRATSFGFIWWHDGQYFYPRPPRGGRHTALSPPASPMIFLSTPSARRATISDLMEIPYRAISIHALREEGDT